jgi:hypothetical protein
MTPSELKYQVEQAGHDSHFFTRDSMKFAGDTMRNYGVCAATITANYNAAGEYVPEGVSVEVWELYRKRPVKHGLRDSAYFDKQTFSRVYAKK